MTTRPRHAGNLRTWIVSDGKIGMENQCRGVAEALGVDAEIKRIDIAKPWRWLPPQLWLSPLSVLTEKGDRLAPPWPDLLIATGRKSVAPALAIRTASGGKTFCVQIQNPGVDPARFDLVIAPQHDGLVGENVVSLLGSPHGVTANKLAQARSEFAALVEPLPQPRIAVLLGGDNAVYRMTDAIADALARQLADAARSSGGGLAITASRRTPASAMVRIRAALTGEATMFYDGKGPNPYLGYLAWADAVIVTADSVNMVTEATATGKPVYVVALDGGSAKFERFHRAMREAGYTRPFEGIIETWCYEPPAETQRAAAEIARRLHLATR
ncbi:MAG: mitochondrial fission ELM1 family protein [Alphaproteobacteria bacterium]|jgi:mitochondrial fission protein ELM1